MLFKRTFSASFGQHANFKILPRILLQSSRIEEERPGNQAQFAAVCEQPRVPQLCQIVVDLLSIPLHRDHLGNKCMTGGEDVMVDVYTSEGRTVPAEVRPLRYPPVSSQHFPRHSLQNVSISFTSHLLLHALTLMRASHSYVLSFACKITAVSTMPRKYNQSHSRPKRHRRFNGFLRAVQSNCFLDTIVQQPISFV